MNSLQKGSVSIFVVIFSALLITVATVSFIRLMLQTERQASTLDLSQSAYDSALDGVEDAKRAIAIGATGPLGGTNCNQVQQALGYSGTETIIEQDTDDQDLSQAYTCVIVDMSTDDYVEDDVNENQSTLVPLSIASGSTFDTIHVEWRRTSVALSPTYRSDTTLPTRGQWGGTVPALLRMRLVWAREGSINLNNDYGSVTATGDYKSAAKSRTMFIIPSSSGVTPVAFVNRTTPIGADCSSAPLGYDCGVDLSIASLISGAAINPADANEKIYLQITPIYKAADIRVSLLNGTDPVPLNGVQAEVDSTGRAGDLFRRVRARVQLQGVTGNYPSDALVIGDGDLCKDFSVTDSTTDYTNSCTP